MNSLLWVVALFAASLIQGVRADDDDDDGAADTIISVIIVLFVIGIILISICVRVLKKRKKVGKVFRKAGMHSGGVVVNTQPVVVQPVVQPVAQPVVPPQAYAPAPGQMQPIPAGQPYPPPPYPAQPYPPAPGPYPPQGPYPPSNPYAAAGAPPSGPYPPGEVAAVGPYPPGEAMPPAAAISTENVEPDPVPSAPSEDMVVPSAPPA